MIQATAAATGAATAAATMAGTAEALDIETSTVEFKANGATASGYFARPKADGKYPAVVVIQEWWGVDDHIKNLTERFAGQGFAALAPDLYHGKVAKEPTDAQKLVMQVQMDQAIKEVQGAVDYLIAQDFVEPDKAGVIGFCFGGGIAMRMSYMGENIGAVVVFYGGGVDPTDEELKQVSAPILGIYGADDRGIPVDKVRKWEEKLKEFDKTNEMHIYEGAPHAFFNDTRAASYRKEASEDAWQRTLDWFKKYLVAEKTS